MTPTDHRSGRGGAPTVREIADLIGRLRELSLDGSDIDPGERAAFLADKDALLARIADSNMASDSERYDGEQAPVRIGEVQMPAWMRDQATRTEASAEGPSLPGGERAARAEALRSQLGNDHAGRFARVAPPAPVDVDEETRRDQLARWHVDDTVISDTQEVIYDDGPGLP